VPHAADWTYSLVFPPSHAWYQLKARESYRLVHEWVRDALAALGLESSLSLQASAGVPGQCFLGAEESDVVHRGGKIAGAAQRRNRLGLLIQGSVQASEALKDRAAFEAAMLWVGSARWRCEWHARSPESELVRRMVELRDTKYGRSEYNESR
jgi:lipoate-protein ligase A